MANAFSFCLARASKEERYITPSSYAGNWLVSRVHILVLNETILTNFSKLATQPSSSTTRYELVRLVGTDCDSIVILSWSLRQGEDCVF